MKLTDFILACVLITLGLAAATLYFKNEIQGMQSRAKARQTASCDSIIAAKDSLLHEYDLLTNSQNRLLKESRTMITELSNAYDEERELHLTYFMKWDSLMFEYEDLKEKRKR